MLLVGSLSIGSLYHSMNHHLHNKHTNSDQIKMKTSYQMNQSDQTNTCGMKDLVPGDPAPEHCAGPRDEPNPAVPWSAPLTGPDIEPNMLHHIS